MNRTLTLLLLLVAFTEAWAAPSMRGSPHSMEKQNIEADRSGLSHIPDDAALNRMRKNGFLVPIPESRALRIDARLDGKWHYVRPWTAKFLADLSEDFYRTFGEPLQVNSAVRTVKRQQELRKQNGNAAEHHGKRRSVHPTGAAIDIAKLGRTGPQIKWLTVRLLELEKRGLIEATEEHVQAVFHIMVFKKYVKTAKKPKPRR